MKALWLERLLNRTRRYHEASAAAASSQPRRQLERQSTATMAAAAQSAAMTPQQPDKAKATAAGRKADGHPAEKFRMPASEIFIPEIMSDGGLHKMTVHHARRIASTAMSNRRKNVPVRKNWQVRARRLK